MAKALYPKKRYVAFRVVGPDKDTCDSASVWNHVFDTLFAMLGSMGMSQARFKKIGFETTSKKGVFRISNSMHRRTLGCLVIAGAIGGKKARLQVLRSSGSLKKLLEEIRIKSEMPRPQKQ